MKKKTKKLIQIGRDSIGIILPPTLLQALGWHKRQRVLVKRMPRGILIRDAISKKRKK